MRDLDLGPLQLPVSFPNRYCATPTKGVEYGHRHADRGWRPMSFESDPKHEYGCMHVGRCPQMGGAALSGVVHLANEDDEGLPLLLRQIDVLRKDNAGKPEKIKELQQQAKQLKAELKAERQKQFRRTQAGDVVEAAVDSMTKGIKKRGTPVGYPGWFRRTPTHILCYMKE
jgi:transposase